MSTSAEPAFYTLSEEKEMEIRDNRSSSTQLYLSERSYKLSDAGLIGRHHQCGSIGCSCTCKSLLDYRRASQGLSGTLAGRDTISAEFDRDGGDELYALYAQACREKDILCFGFKASYLTSDR